MEQLVNEVREKIEVLLEESKSTMEKALMEKKLAEDAGETYGYDQELDMSPENTTVIQDWKYALHVYLYYRAGSNRCDGLCSKHFCGNR